MSDSGLTVPAMTGPPRRYDVTITVDRDGGRHPNPAEFAVAAGQAASARAASIVSAHTAGQIISVVTVQAADQPAAVAVALAVVSEALSCPVASPARLTSMREDPCRRTWPLDPGLLRRNAEKCQARVLLWSHGDGTDRNPAGRV